MGTIRTPRRFRLWICFALGLSCAAALLAPGTPASAAPAESERATRQLFQAVQSADLPAVQASVAAGADVDARDRWGLTPTDIAIDRGHYRIAHFLVSVRNQRRAQQAPEQAQQTPAAAALRAAPAAGLVPSVPPSDGSRLETLPLAGGRTTAADWPAGKPNPFDPTAPAPGSQLAPSRTVTR